MRPLRHKGHDPAVSRHERQADPRESEERQGQGGRAILRLPEQNLLQAVQQLERLRRDDRPETAAKLGSPEHAAPHVPRRGGREGTNPRHDRGRAAEEARANDAAAGQTAHGTAATADQGELPALLRRHDRPDKRHLRRRTAPHAVGRETRVRHLRPKFQRTRGREMARAV